MIDVIFEIPTPWGRFCVLSHRPWFHWFARMSKEEAEYWDEYARLAALEQEGKT